MAMTEISYLRLLGIVQEQISKNYSALLTNQARNRYLPVYLEKYIRDNGYTVNGMPTEQVLKKLYDDMVRYSILTAYLDDPTVEEINVNAWDDVAVTYMNGQTVKLKEHFYSPGQAVDTVKRLLQNSGMVIDNASPISMGHLNSRIRITVLKTPIVDEEIGIAVSIRVLHPQSINLEKLLNTGFAEPEMLDFLLFCLRHHVSVVVAGVTSSGKTTLLNALLESVPDEKRIFTIETGSRELSLVKRRDGRTENNVVHTLSRPSENPSFDISQENLLEAALRFHPDLICVGEMRNVECYAAVQATQTGHTVISSVHARTAEESHRRIALLCEQRMPMPFEIALMLAVEAFPIVVTTNLLENHERKIVSITECSVAKNGAPHYRVLWAYEVENSEPELHGELSIRGRFRKVHPMSETLKSRFQQAAAPLSEIRKFMKMEKPL